MSDRILEFVAKYENKLLAWPKGMYAGECLSLAKQYIQEMYDIYPPASGTGSAYGYWLNFPDPLGSVLEKVEYAPGLVPNQGDIVIWRPTPAGVYGHIDIFVCGDERRFVGFDQNWGGRKAHLVMHDYQNVVGWLRGK